VCATLWCHHLAAQVQDGPPRTGLTNPPGMCWKGAMWRLRPDKLAEHTTTSWLASRLPPLSSGWPGSQGGTIPGRLPLTASTRQPQRIPSQGPQLPPGHRHCRRCRRMPSGDHHSYGPLVFGLLHTIHPAEPQPACRRPTRHRSSLFLGGSMQPSVGL
jgi:hypothetical protein